MIVLSPNDNRVNDRHSPSAPRDRRFSGRRQVTENTEKAEDYTKFSTERRANMTGETDEKIFNPVEETLKDLDEMNNDQIRKREVSRRAETSTTGYDQDSNPYRRPGDADDKEYSDPDNRPLMDSREDEVREPDPEKKHGDRNPWRIGQDYDERGDQNIGQVGQKPR